MISPDEIDGMAEALTVNVADVERDYVNGWLLAGIFGSALSSSLVLKGGNALRKGYFANTRYSVDLDFTAPHGVDQELLASELLQVTRFVTEKTGVQFLDDTLEVLAPTRVTRDVEVLEVKAHFKDFYGDDQALPIRVYMDIAEYDRIVLPIRECQLIHPYSDAATDPPIIRCVALEEILATKLKCLLQRRKSGDLFDYIRWLVFDDLPVDRSQVLEVFLEKTIYSRAPGAAYDLLMSLPVGLFQKSWDLDIVAPSTCAFEFAAGVERYREHLDALFGEQRHSKPWRLSFFPPEQREPIMKAGQNQHLMRLLYDGYSRVVEPYALKYKVTKEGGGREYFYAYDRSGGSSGERSIKTFVADKVQRIEELEETFEPRFEIELSQAAEFPSDLHFGGRRGDGFVPGFGITRPSRSASSRKYRFRCPVCRKQFARVGHDNDISGHKHPRGYQCPGSWGVYLGYR